MDGLEFCAPTPLRWYVRARRTPALVTTPLAQAMQRSVKHHLPRGDDALAWHRVMNEAQMILHAHPVTAAREARGATGANSIWLWGGGTLPVRTQSTDTAMWGGAPLAPALAKWAGVAYGELPASCADWLNSAEQGSHLLTMDTLTDAWQTRGAAAWREELELVDRLWLRPILSALRKKQITTLTLVACNVQSQLVATVRPADCWRFWRRARPLATYADNA